MCNTQEQKPKKKFNKNIRDNKLLNCFQFIFHMKTNDGQEPVTVCILAEPLLNSNKPFRYHRGMSLCSMDEEINLEDGINKAKGMAKKALLNKITDKDTLIVRPEALYVLESVGIVSKKKIYRSEYDTRLYRREKDVVESQLLSVINKVLGRKVQETESKTEENVILNPFKTPKKSKAKSTK